MEVLSKLKRCFAKSKVLPLAWALEQKQKPQNLCGNMCFLGENKKIIKTKSRYAKSEEEGEIRMAYGQNRLYR